ncbi:MAG TPA: tetratricopeptide repeat protein [Pyrinomonadaceae bacterium]|nr:tetratricopeptide repeat protein [Pyrinomonadaceae bacterium]
MPVKYIVISLVAVVLSFIGGFLIANAFNRAEIESMRRENDGYKNAANVAANQSENAALSAEAIKEKVDEADSNPDNTDFQRNLGLALYRYASAQQDLALLEDSIRLLERARIAKSNDQDVLIALGNANFDIAYFGKANERYVVARRLYDEGVSLSPENPDLLTDRGLTYFLSEPADYSAAEREFAAALAIAPNNERTLQLAIEANWQLGQMQRATELLERLKETNPQNPAIPDLSTRLLRPPPTP